MDDSFGVAVTEEIAWTHGIASAIKKENEWLIINLHSLGKRKPFDIPHICV